MARAHASDRALAWQVYRGSLVAACFAAPALPAYAADWTNIANLAIAACSESTPEAYDDSLKSAGFVLLTDTDLPRVAEQFTYSQRLATYARSGELPNPALHGNALTLFSGVVELMMNDTETQDSPRIYTFPGDDAFFVITSATAPVNCGFTHTASPEDGALHVGEFDDTVGILTPDATAEVEFLTEAVRVPNGNERPVILYRQMRPKDGSETAFGGDAIVSQWNISP